VEKQQKDENWAEDGADSQSAEERPVLGIIESRVLIRDCLTRCLSQMPSLDVIGVNNAEEWLARCKDLNVFVLLLSLNGCPSLEANRASIRRLANACPNAPVIVLADGESLERIVPVFEDGARGYIPTSLTLKVALDAMRLVKEGGVYLPQSSLAAAQQGSAGGNGRAHPLRQVFTGRQLEVLDALCQGKANKIIAYELDMCESTVKVHIRNIMKKLKATNRTEVAYKANEMLGRAAPLSAPNGANGKAAIFANA
jgi:DNA-binding NarL/FixJ family response regulator